MDCWAGYRFLGKKHGNSLAQGSSGERRRERRQHCEAVLFADLLHGLDDDRLPGADDKDLAAELPAHKNFKNFSGLDTIDRQSENDEVGKLGVEDRPRIVVLCALAGYEAEIFKDVGEECPKVFLAVRNAYTRHNLATTEGCGASR